MWTFLFFLFCAAFFISIRLEVRLYREWEKKRPLLAPLGSSINNNEGKKINNNTVYKRLIKQPTNPNWSAQFSLVFNKAIKMSLPQHTHKKNGQHHAKKHTAKRNFQIPTMIRWLNIYLNYWVITTVVVVFAFWFFGCSGTHQHVFCWCVCTREHMCDPKMPPRFLLVRFRPTSTTYKLNTNTKIIRAIHFEKFTIGVPFRIVKLVFLFRPINPQQIIG